MAGWTKRKKEDFIAIALFYHVVASRYKDIFGTQKFEN